MLLVDPNDADEMAAAERLNERLVDARARDGRHLHRRARHRPGKITFLEAEHGDGARVMRAIKHALDPENIMNPGRLFRRE